MNDTYLKTLEYLEEWEIDRKVEIAYKLVNWFKNQKNVNPNEAIESINGRIIRFCIEMQQNQHIKFESQPNDYNNEPEIKVQARLTYLGLQYLNEYRLTKSNIDLNQSIKTNIRNQIIIGVITLAAIIVAAIYSVMVYYKDDSENLIMIRKSLQQIGQKLQNSQQLQKEKSMPSKITAKTTFPKNP